MSMISNLVERLLNHATELNQYYDRDYTIKLLKECADTIRMLSDKLHNHNMERSSNFYDGKRPFLVKINNVPINIEERYIVIRKEHTELWYYGQYDNEDFAYKVAEEIGNGFVIEVVE